MRGGGCNKTLILTPRRCAPKGVSAGVGLVSHSSLCSSTAQLILGARDCLHTMLQSRNLHGGARALAPPNSKPVAHPTPVLSVAHAQLSPCIAHGGSFAASRPGPSSSRRLTGQPGATPAAAAASTEPATKPYLSVAKGALRVNCVLVTRCFSAAPACR